jgi:Ca2+-transporting ATPase
VFFETGVFSNVRLVAVVVVTVFVQVTLHQLPATEDLFVIGAISFGDCMGSLAVALIPVTIIEVFKLARRGARRYSQSAA